MLVSQNGLVWIPHAWKIILAPLCFASLVQNQSLSQRIILSQAGIQPGHLGTEKDPPGSSVSKAAIYQDLVQWEMLIQ